MKQKVLTEMKIKCKSSLRKLNVVFSVLMLITGAVAQAPCEFGSPEAANNLERTLEKAPTCDKAASLLSQCRWGSSADVGFGSIVVKKCEKELLPKLSVAGKARLQKERGLCQYEYQNQDGTLFTSESVMCVVYLLQKFTANPEQAELPLPRASFDCAKAKTSLENAICSDTRLGEADIVLARAYRPLFRSTPLEKRPQITDLQKTWLIGVEKKCKVGKGPLQIDVRTCVRREFEKRFSDLDGCSVGGWDECLFQLSGEKQ